LVRILPRFGMGNCMKNKWVKEGRGDLVPSKGGRAQTELKLIALRRYKKENLL
jgi:hypothetical protein